MAMNIMKLEPDRELCCVCNTEDTDLMTPDEYDANNLLNTPLRVMLLHLNKNKVVTEGRYCQTCIQRAVAAFEFCKVVSARTEPPLSEKIRALRRKLHELTQKIDVFIVVGGAGNNGQYSEDDIIMVEKDALAAAAAADDKDLEQARNARGDTVYQCSVCPLSFQRVLDYRDHMETHPGDAIHCCWSCGAQFSTLEALREHNSEHSVSPNTLCHICNSYLMSVSEMRRHEEECTSRCPGCGEVFQDRRALAAHVGSVHGRASVPPHVCPACFQVFNDPLLLSAHLLKHRQAKQFVCGYDGCILRFGTRTNLLAHIRKCHTTAEEEPPTMELPPTTTCPHCDRTFGSVASLKRHMRVHSRVSEPENAQVVLQDETEMMETDGGVEYLELEALDEVELEQYEAQELKHLIAA